MKASTISLKILKGIGVFIFWIGVWYLASLLIDKEIFLPYPHTVALRFLELSGTAGFWTTVAASLARILRGFIYGVVFGSGIALLTHYSSLAGGLISPFIRMVRAVPVASFTLLLFLWLDNDMIPVFIALLMVAPIMWENLSAGLRAMDKGLIEMARVYRIPRWKTLKKIIFPSLSPYFYSGMLTGLGLAWKSGIAAEVISYPSVAIGKALGEAKTYLETADVFVWTVVVIALSLAFEGLIRLLFRKRRKKV
ncbi:MAG: ABC transporter permease subunit [Clostridia bacterium]|nr:ABC transporter permease subunit [Clostridia bacterium]